MSEAIKLLIHFFVSAIKLLKPGGVKVVMSESMAMKQQLIVMNRGKKRSPKLATSDGYGRISMQMFKAFGTTISRFTVGISRTVKFCAAKILGCNNLREN